MWANQQKNHDSETSFLKSANESLKRELAESMQGTSKARSDAIKQEETVAYLFTRAKTLNGLITSFYNHTYGSKEVEHSKSEYVLSFEAMQQKLERLFKDHENLIKAPKRFDFVEISDVESVRSGFNSLNNGSKDKRSVSNNATPKVDSVFRSKSPAPNYKGNGVLGHKLWNEGHRLK